MKKAISQIFLILLLMTVLASSIHLAYTPAPGSVWPMFQHDPQHTGRSPYVGPTENPQAQILLGNVDVNEIFGCPVVGSDDILYLGYERGASPWGFCAIYPNGTLKWFLEIQPEGGGWSLLYPPALLEVARTVFFRTDTEAFAVNMETGSLRWTASFASIFDSLVVGNNGILYLTVSRGLPDGSYHIYVVGLNENGEETLSYDVGEYGVAPSCPTIDEDGTIYVGYNDTLFAINPSGTEKWQRTFVADIKYNPPSWLTVTTPSIAPDGTLYVVVLRESDYGGIGGGYYNILHAIDPGSSADKWNCSYSCCIGTFGPYMPPSVDSVGNVYVTSSSYAPGSGASFVLLAFTPEGYQFRYLELDGGFLLIDSLNDVFSTGTPFPSNPGGLFIVDSSGNKETVTFPFQEGYRLQFLSLSADGTLYVGGVKTLYEVKSVPQTGDFSITASPNSSSVEQGSSNCSTITVSSIEGFNQPVHLTVSGVPSGVIATLSSEIVIPPTDGNDLSILTVSATTTATPGTYTLTVTGTNGTLYHSVDVSVEVTKVHQWSFAIITDLHVGWGYCDYGAPGYDDANPDACQDYWLTKRLENVVEKIIEDKNGSNIKFVVVLGDIADSAEKSELLMARKILNKLNDPNEDGLIADGIPYIPLTGNHDIWPYTTTQGSDPDIRIVDTAVNIESYDPNSLGDRFFNKTFWEDPESQNNRDLIDRVFGVTWNKQTQNSSPYLQNYIFTFASTSFVCLDFSPRNSSIACPGTPQNNIRGAGIERYDDTNKWFSDFINENRGKKVVAFCHYPFSPEGGFFSDPLEYAYLSWLILENNVEVYDFGGHTHWNHVSTSFIPRYVAVETEAVFEESQAIIRIVKVTDQDINFDKLEGISSDVDSGLGLYFVFSPRSPSSGESIHFVARTVDFIDWLPWELHTVKELGPECSACYYTWSFGDGETLSGYGSITPGRGADDPTHSYDYFGVYYVSLTVTAPEGTLELNDYPISVDVDISPPHLICGLSENMQAYSVGRDVNLTLPDGDAQNSFERVLISKTVSDGIPIVEFGVHFENATEDISLTSFAADVDVAERKAFFHMPTWPSVIEESKILYIPSTGAGAVYICLNATSMDEVKPENADYVINVGATKNGITVTTTSYNGNEYYLVYGVTGTGGGEFQTANGGGGRMPYMT